MRAAVLHDDATDLSIDDVTIDTPGPGEVLMRTAASGLCHSDLHFMQRDWEYPTPVVLGHEAAGRVEAVGEGVTEFVPGDHVIACVSVFCGACEFCVDGRTHLCINSGTTGGRPEGAPSRLRSATGAPVNQFANLGTFAEQMLVGERALVKIREDMPLDRAALIGCGVTTGTGAVFKTAGVEPGASVAVIGCGGVGMAVVQAARIAGATRIVAVDTEPRKLDAAAGFGATDVVNPNDGDPVAQVLDLTAGGVDYAFEAIGLKATAEQAFRMAKRGGTATIIGMMRPGTMVEVDGVDLFMSEKRLQGSLMGSNAFRVDMPKLVDLYLDGRLQLDDMVSDRIQIDAINSGFEAMKAGDVVRSVIEFDAD